MSFIIVEIFFETIFQAMKNQETKDSTIEREEILRLIAERKKEIDVLKRVYEKLSSSSNSMIKTDSRK